MKTTESGFAGYRSTKSRKGLYWGLGFAATAGLAFGLASRWVKVDLDISFNRKSEPVAVVDTARISEPTSADKHLIGNAFTEAFGPPAGLPTDLAQAALDLPVPPIQEPQPLLARAQFTEPAAPTQAALTSGHSFAIPQSAGNCQNDVVYFAQPVAHQAIQGFNLHLLQGTGCNSNAGLTGTAVTHVNLVAPYPQANAGTFQFSPQACVAGQCQVQPYIYRQIVGSDGLERIGVDFENNTNNTDVNLGFKRVGFFVADPNLNDPAKGDTKQSAGGMGGSAKIGPSAPGSNQIQGTLGAQNPEPLVGSFTTEIEDGYLKLPEELVGWVMEAKLFVAPGPDGCLRMSTLDGLEEMFQEEANEALRASHNAQMNAGYAAPLASPEASQDRRDRRTMRKFYGLMTACQPEEDEDGNLWIPIGSQLAKQAGLKNEVVIVGMRTHVEIWSQQSWDAEITEPKTAPAPKALELQKIDIRKGSKPSTPYDK